jgi:methylmalonyl-CoA carboxyltransferase large subunit
MTAEPADVAAALDALRREVARLGERVAALEAAGGRGQESAVRGQQQEPALPPPDRAPAEGVSEEVVLVISAAVAAFLRKRPRIRQVRLLGSAAWAQQGRVTIQASHALRSAPARSPQ